MQTLISFEHNRHTNQSAHFLCINVEGLTELEEILPTIFCKINFFIKVVQGVFHFMRIYMFTIGLTNNIYWPRIYELQLS